MDLLAAADLAANAISDYDWYYANSELHDIDKMSGSITDRVRSYNGTPVDAARVYLQTIDGATKYLEYTGAVDSAFARGLDSITYKDFEYIRSSYRNNRDDKRWLICYLVAQTIKIRISRYVNSAHAEWAAESFVTECIEHSETLNCSLPDVRLAVNVIQHLVEYPFSEMVQKQLFATIKRKDFLLVFIDLLFPGLSSSFESISYIQQERKLHPVSVIITDSLYKSFIFECKKRSAEYYHGPKMDMDYGPDDSDTNHILRSGIGPLELDHLVLDKYYLLRLLMHKCASGQSTDAINLAFAIQKQGGESRISPAVTYYAVKYVLSNVDRLSLNDNQKLYFKAAAVVNGYTWYERMVKSTYPWSASVSQSQLHSQLLSWFYEIDIENRDNKQYLNLQSEVYKRLLLMRAASTAVLRNAYPEYSCDGAQWSSVPIPIEICNGVLEYFEDRNLAENVVGQKIDEVFLDALQNISWGVNQYFRMYRSYGRAQTIRAESKWKPNDSTIYIAVDRYRRGREEFTLLSDTLAAKNYWSITALSNDRLYYSRELSDSSMVSMLARKHRALSYGLNESTAIDSIIFDLVERSHVHRKAKAKRIVVLPHGLFYMFNPYLAVHCDRYLADSFDVIVATSIGNKMELSDSQYRIAFLQPEGLDLSDASNEYSRVSDLCIENKWRLLSCDSVNNERELVSALSNANILHISSHAMQANLVTSTVFNKNILEIFGRQDVGVTARRLMSPLIQYKSSTRDTGKLFGDGYISPIEMQLYNLKCPKLVYLNTCQTITATSDACEPPDGILRELFSLGAECIISAPIAVPDRYAASFSAEFYKALGIYGTAYQAVTHIIRSRGAGDRSALSFGSYYPVYFSSD
jgi:hypothetical protein